MVPVRIIVFGQVDGGLKTSTVIVTLHQEPGNGYIMFTETLQFETTFSPAMEAINVKMKNSRQKSVGSLKSIIPSKAVPVAPMPVHTA